MPSRATVFLPPDKNPFFGEPEQSTRPREIYQPRQGVPFRSRPKTTVLQPPQRFQVGETQECQPTILTSDHDPVLLRKRQHQNRRVQRARDRSPSDWVGIQLPQAEALIFEAQQASRAARKKCSRQDTMC